MSTWIYVFDEFKPIEINTSKLFKLAEENPLELFGIVKEALADNIKEVKDVKIHDIYFDPSNSELLIEYLVRCELGEVSVKIIYSRNPAVTLSKYYEHERGLSSCRVILRQLLLSLYITYSIVGAIELMPTLAITRIGKYFRTTVPREVRKLLGLRENDEIEWIFENGKIIIKKKGEKRD